MIRTDVLIAGAGPSGLVLALWLTKLGVSVRIIDKAPEAGTTSRAVAIAAHTLELYRQLDLATSVMQRAHAVKAANLWVEGKAVAHVPFAQIGQGLSPYGLLQIFPQDAHERLLIEKLGQFGVTIERPVQLVDFSDDGEKIVARLQANDHEEQCEAAFIAGCDGAHSIVRTQIHADFEGGTYRELFYVADVDAAGQAANGELHVDLDEADFLAVFPLSDQGRVRLIGTVRDARVDHADRLSFDDVSGHALKSMNIQIRQVNWFSTYHVHHRVTDRFRVGRAFLVGDAAHVHSPVGGQGMNTGIGDAINLAWKIAAVNARCAPDSLLDSYEVERRRFAKRLVATTDRVFTFINEDGPLAKIVRKRVAPIVVPRLLSMDRVRDFIFRTVSQLSLNYREGPLAVGSVGEVHGGDRLPWVPQRDDSNLAPLANLDWQVYVYGAAGPELLDWCDRHRVPLHVFEWHEQHGEAGLTRDALYLLRPDTYIALADRDASTEALNDFFTHRGVQRIMRPLIRK